jgi:nitrate/TMAO reductase-like tetraheme cytochrome c subunit
MTDEATAQTPALARNPISVFGAWLTTLSAFAFIAYYFAESLGLFASPYSGLFGFVALPGLFVLGLLLIPIGMWREARRRRRGLAAWRWPAVDLGQSRTRQVVVAVGVLTIINFAIVAVAGLGAVHYMETDAFCGQVCHVPMRPEFTAHQIAPHAEVNCVQCHVSPGAAGMVRAKMNGTRQMFHLLANSFPRPIPSSPAHNIPDAADTCERCHSPEYPVRDITKTTYEYDNDEANSETVTTYKHFTEKNHWHTRGGRVVEYIATDEKRTTIPYVKVTERNGQVTEYFGEDVTAVPSGERRRMDCLDCHSRPAHRFAASAELAVDEAIGAGRVARSLPFVRKEMVAALKASYSDEAAAESGIRARMAEAFKSADAAAKPEVDRAIAESLRLYRANVFPEMNVTWGTYVSQIGHSETDGCFRCHDDEHKTRDGARIVSQGCKVCHVDPAAKPQEEEEDEPE